MKNILLAILLFACDAFAANTGSRCITPFEQQLRLLTFNIQVNTSLTEVAPWKLRALGIGDLIRRGGYHLASLQEVLNPMLNDLSGLLPDYSVITVGRDDGRYHGEMVTLLYLRSRLELAETGYFWLSATPDVPGSVGWDASVPRVVAWALFQDRMTKKSFYVFNTHLDHWGEVAQIESAKLLGTVASLKPDETPHLVLGDFNSKPRGPVYETFLAYSGMKDAMFAGPHEGPNWTYSLFGSMKSKIDYAFVSSNVRVCQHWILPEEPDAPLSDHLPLSVQIELTK